MPAPAYYAWGADWMPLAVRLNIELVDTINNAMATMGRCDPERDLEIGGILLGTVDGRDGEHPVVRIERFDPVSSEHRRGSSYGLTDRDKKILARKLEWWVKHGAKDGLRPVGFFRSHTRRGLYLDNEDFTLYQHYFPEPASIFLLVRPMAGAESVGGFFFWEEGDMHREASYQEFPFQAERLPLVAAEQVAPPVPVANPVPATPVPLTPLQAAPPIVRVPTAPPPLPPPAAVRRLSPWLQIVIPLAVGILLGAVVFGLATRSGSPRTTQSAAVLPSPAKPVPQPASTPAIVEKPSPLAPKSRPVASPMPRPAVAGPAVVVATADRAMSSNPAASPTGSASRTDASAASATIPAAVLAPAPTPVAEATPPPAAEPLAPITAPARVERPRRPPSLATVTVEPVSGSKLGRVVGHINPFHRRKQGFIPARPIRQVAPEVPANEHLARDVPVDLRITVDPAGNVADVEQASHGANRQLVRLASDAARSWQFVPARNNDETVTSELILHFRFPGSRAE